MLDNATNVHLALSVPGLENLKVSTSLPTKPFWERLRPVTAVAITAFD
jgi:hypothetical protein